MDCKFVVGQRVVCIVEDGDWKDVGDNLPRGIFPRYMSVWKIRDMLPVIRGMSVINGVWVSLDGWRHDDWFSSGSFRPVKETKTDVSVFRKLLAPTKIKEDA
jgi:hypothetical protein